MKSTSSPKNGLSGARRSAPRRWRGRACAARGRRGGSPCARSATSTSPTRPRATPSGLTRTRVRSDTACAPGCSGACGRPRVEVRRRAVYGVADGRASARRPGGGRASTSAAAPRRGSALAARRPCRRRRAPRPTRARKSRPSDEHRRDEQAGGQHGDLDSSPADADPRRRTASRDRGRAARRARRATQPAVAPRRRRCDRHRDRQGDDDRLEQQDGRARSTLHRPGLTPRRGRAGRGPRRPVTTDPVTSTPAAAELGGGLVGRSIARVERRRPAARPTSTRSAPNTSTAIAASASASSGARRGAAGDDDLGRAPARAPPAARGRPCPRARRRRRRAR